MLREVSNTTRKGPSKKMLRVYRELGNKNMQIKKPPGLQETKYFWQDILEQEVEYNKQAQWIREQEQILM